MVKVGDTIRILVDGAEGADVKEGDTFVVSKIIGVDGSIEVEGRYEWHFSPESYEVISKHLPLKDPIEYLKAVYADGDMADPVAMLRECYGITKTVRSVVEWHEAKPREIKVGDMVRIVGDSCVEWSGLYKIGDIRPVTELLGEAVRLQLGPKLRIYFPLSSVEPV